jgi:hypothetical protein
MRCGATAARPRAANKTPHRTGGLHRITAADRFRRAPRPDGKWSYKCTHPSLELVRSLGPGGWTGPVGIQRLAGTTRLSAGARRRMRPPTSGVTGSRAARTCSGRTRRPSSTRARRACRRSRSCRFGRARAARMTTENTPHSADACGRGRAGCGRDGGIPDVLRLGDARGAARQG